MIRSLQWMISRRPRGWAQRAGDHGQAALAMVLGIVMLLVTGGTLLASNTVQHDPLVQGDVVTHYAYRALESGINSYLNTINAQPNLVNCSSAQSALATCDNIVNGIVYDKWTQVPDTTTTGGNVPEWYLWTNPQFCFSTTKTYAAQCTSSTATHNFQYVREMVIGAAGTPGHYAYQSSIADFAPRNGFLTHLWWSDYESAPTNRTATRNACQFDWANSYNGPGGACRPVYFAGGTHVDGPVYSNDSIYVIGTPTFGATGTPSTVTTHDPSCLFVTQPGTTDSKPTRCKTAANGIYFTTTNSRSNAPKETPPVTDTQLLQVAQKGGCVYSGPTTISFYATATNHKGYMNVTSPETPLSGTHDNDNISINDNVCTGAGIPVPTATKGNGVIFVQTTSTGSCAGNHVNPFEGTRTGQKATTAQIVDATNAKTGHGYNYTDDVVHTSAVDCEGDAFVRNADKSNTPAGRAHGIAGNLTVAAANNVVITGTLTYADCGPSWNSKTQCTYRPGTVNDSLGLIANNYVEVNRPVVPKCTRYTWHYHKNIYNCTATDGTTAQGWSVLGRCGTTVTDLQAVLCNPAKPNLVIDAAILDLSHEFTVDNYGAGSTTGTLVINGAIDQYWRGPIGLVGYSGYNKYYTWDSRLQYVSIPYYLTPGTPSWAITSSSVVMSTACPPWPEPYGTTGSIPVGTTEDPSGTTGAC
ncbi:MAG: hypothetical protein ACRDYZ_16010 [Acidimicrobiales bacterium]